MYIYILYDVICIFRTLIIVYDRTDIATSDSILTKFLSGDFACTASTWTTPSIPDTTSCPRDDADHAANCFYGDTYFTQLLQPIGTTLKTRACMNNTKRLSSAACDSCAVGCSDTPSAAVSCYLNCAQGATADPEAFLGVLCNLQRTVQDFIDRSEEYTTARTNAFVYTILFSNLLFILIVEWVQPTRNKLRLWGDVYDKV